MEELSIEEKAKAYDIALDKIKMLLGTGSSCSREELEYVFPELKESEDKGIKRMIKRSLEFASAQKLIKYDDLSKMLAWLEKQGEHANFLNNIQIGDRVTRNEDGVLVNLSQLKRVAKKDENQGEQKLDKWEPQTGDIFRKKGTTSPTYHLCNKREDGITFGFGENREVGISGGEITIFALKNDYELVERPKLIEDVVEEELNRALQTKGEQNPAWSEEDEQLYNDLSDTYFYNDEDYPEETYKLMLKRVLDWMTKRAKSLRPQSQWKPSDEQIKVCKEVYADILSAKGFDLGTVNSELNRLEEQLKKQKE